MSEQRKRARQLAAEAVARGEPTAWFEQLYGEAARGEAVVPWADRCPNAALVRWLDARSPAPGGRALDVGCGLGDDADELARRGLRVTAFDIAPTAVREAQARFGRPGLSYEVADLLSPPEAWRGAFSLVFEAYTLQVLPPEQRRVAVENLRTFVAPGGVLLLVARARDPGDDPGAMPWPLTRAEVESVARGDLSLVALADFFDEETPPVRRFLAEFARTQA